MPARPGAGWTYQPSAYQALGACLPLDDYTRRDATLRNVAQGSGLNRASGAPPLRLCPQSKPLPRKPGRASGDLWSEDGATWAPSERRSSASRIVRQSASSVRPQAVGRVLAAIAARAVSVQGRRSGVGDSLTPRAWSAAKAKAKAAGTLLRSEIATINCQTLFDDRLLHIDYQVVEGGGESVSETPSPPLGGSRSARTRARSVHTSNRATHRDRPRDRCRTRAHQRRRSSQQGQ